MNCLNRHLLALGLILSVFALRANGIFQVDTLHAYSPDCQSANVCMPIPAADFSHFIVFQNGSPYASGVAGCDFDTTITYSYNTLFGLGSMGPYHLDSWSVNGQPYNGTFMNIPDLVYLLNQWDPAGGWQQDPSSLSIKGGAPGSDYSDMGVTVMLNSTQSIIGLNLGLLPLGSEMQFQTGLNSVIAYDLNTGAKDTVLVMVECLVQPPPAYFYDTIPADSLPYTLCLNNFNFFGTPVSIENTCADQSGEFVDFYLDENNYCVKYAGLKCNGTEQACIVVCDDIGMCDTTYLFITVDGSLCQATHRKIVDTLLINFDSVYCLDLGILPSSVTSIENICPDESGESVDFEFDPVTNCVTYTGFAPGLDQACYLITDEYGNTDTTTICVYVKLPETGTIIDTIVLGSNETYCFDTTELAGNIASITNICPDFSGEEVDFTINNVSLCVLANGIALGTDSACIVICDDYGVCDTTYIYVTVVPNVNDPCANPLPPDAVDDLASTPLNTPVNIEILANDSLGNCLPIEIYVLDVGSGGNGPYHGLTVLNPNRTVDYFPFQGFCGLDFFQYALCNAGGCDTATVVVKIACSEDPGDIIIYNGFSPNGDGSNEVFKIENIEYYPDSELAVFNRWGTLVYHAIGYQNDWQGTYKDKDLPDGTYFYRLDLGSKSRKYDGFVQLQR
jgi:gliding motility-associated-like protein